MPGARKTFDDKIAAIDKKIDNLITEKNELIEKKEQSRKDDLLRIIDKSGLSVDDLRVLIANNKKDK